MAGQITYATKVGLVVATVVIGSYLACAGAAAGCLGLGAVARRDAERQLQDFQREAAEAQIRDHEAQAAAKQAQEAEAKRQELEAASIAPESEKEAFEAELFAAERAFAPDTDER